MREYLVAIVYGLIDSPDSNLSASGYTHTVVICERDDYQANGVAADAYDLIDFKTEFAARTYADAVNMGLSV